MMANETHKGGVSKMIRLPFETCQVSSDLNSKKLIGNIKEEFRQLYISVLRQIKLIGRQQRMD